MYLSHVTAWLTCCTVVSERRSRRFRVKTGFFSFLCVISDDLCKAGSEKEACCMTLYGHHVDSSLSIGVKFHPYGISYLNINSINFINIHGDILACYSNDE